jgi:DNA-binding transcriptional MerR regulator
MEKTLPAIPAKRYFTIGEVSDLCGVKPYVLRYWEQEFTQLKPIKRRGNRRYYQHHEVLLIRRIRELLYDQGFTISGARNRLSDLGALSSSGEELAALVDEPDEVIDADALLVNGLPYAGDAPMPSGPAAATGPGMGLGAFTADALPDVERLRAELQAIRGILLL